MQWTTETYVGKEGGFQFWTQDYFFKTQFNPGVKAILKVIASVLNKNWIERNCLQSFGKNLNS